MFTFQPLCAGFGLETSDVDVSQPLDDAAFAELEAAFFRGQVLVLREQRLTAAQFVAFARRFGPPEPHVIDQFHHPDDPNILILSNVVIDGEPQGLADAGTLFPHRLLVPRRARARDDALFDRGADRRRRHAVREPVRGVRRRCPTR